MKKFKAFSGIALSCASLLSLDAAAPPPSPDAPLKVENSKSYNIVVGAQFVYLKYTTTALAYGRDGIGLTNSVPAQEIPVSKTGTAFSPKFNYQPGFRASLGAKFGPKKAFDLIAQYSWLQAHPKGSVSARDFSSSFLPISWLVERDIASATYQSASLQADIFFHLAELQSGYTFGINRYFSLRPYIALLSIIVDGDLNARYAFTTPASLTMISKTHGSCFSWAIGPKIGLDFSYFMTKNFGIYCNGNFTHQATRIWMKTKQTDFLPQQGQSFIIQKGKLIQDHSIAIVGLEIGPTWDQWFCNNRYRLQLRATWQTATLAGANLSFLNNNNIDVAVGAEFRGINLRAALEF